MFNKKLKRQIVQQQESINHLEALNKNYVYALEMFMRKEKVMVLTNSHIEALSFTKPTVLIALNGVVNIQNATLKSKGKPVSWHSISFKNSIIDFN